MDLATGKEIILEIVRSMQANLEPLLFSTIAPARYYVYLHPSDYKRLEGVIPLIVDQARRALDDEVKKWNERARSRSPLNWVRGEAPVTPIESLPEGWDIRFEPDADEEMAPGDIAIACELTLPPQSDYEGSRTRRITTLRHGEETRRREQVVPAPSPEPAGGTVHATLTYQDRRGKQRVAITKDHVVIGRGGVGYWVDVKIDSSPDVSREHIRLRRDEATGRFFLKDLSTLGTTIDGVPVPTSVEVIEGRKRDKGVEVPLPPRARIGLADTVFLDFEASSTS
jgi:FHA domain